MKNRLIIVLGLPLSAFALECPVDELAVFTQQQPTSDPHLYVEADAVKATQKHAHFQGNIVANRGQEVFHAKSLDYSRVDEHLRSSEENTFGHPSFALRSQTANYSLKTKTGQFDNIEYYQSDKQAVGHATKLTADRNAQTEDLVEATYTTCARRNPAWFLKAKEMHLDHQAGIGEAWHATFHIGKTPVMYLPYMTFPINDERKTGFLMPKINISTTRGFDLTLPFYLNIAPNQDATLYPRWMQKRGFMLGGEYRYLLPSLSGNISGAYLPKDKQTQTTRWGFRTTHHYQPSANFWIDVDYQRVSDRGYLNDLQSNLKLDNDNFLKSHLTVNYIVSPNYKITASINDYQVANKAYTQANEPYRLLPKINGDGLWYWGNVKLTSNTEIINFDKKNVISGLRFDQTTALSYRYENSYAFVEPSLTYRFTSYQLRNQSVNRPKHITRSIPSFSLDSGLIFDRSLNLFGHDMTQTLEPRLFYLYTPYQDQSGIPNFDSGLASLTYSAFFLNNRFTGKDRIGDANQLTTAVSTRFIDNNSGHELAKLSIGQIQYFQDRRVSLNQSVAQSAQSNIIAEGSIQPTPAFKIHGLVHYDNEQRRRAKSIIGASYTKTRDKGFNLSYTQDLVNFEQVDFSGVWRINDYWRSFWRWNYSIEYKKSIDILAGIEYADCCWGLRLIAQRKRANLTSNLPPENTVFLEFILKDLGSVGSDTSTILSKLIPNYKPIRYE